MMRFDPLREIEDLQQRMDQLFRGGQGRSSARYAPLVDVSEDERGLEISLDLPGIRPEDIRVEAENNTVTVQAERRSSSQDRTSHRSERVYGSFARSFNVPSSFDLSKVEAHMEHGTLTLHIPKSVQAQRRQIQVQGGSRTLEAQSSDLPGTRQENMPQGSMSGQSTAQQGAPGGSSGSLHPAGQVSSANQDESRAPEQDGGTSNDAGNAPANSNETGHGGEVHPSTARDPGERGDAKE